MNIDKITKRIVLGILFISGLSFLSFSIIFSKDIPTGVLGFTCLAFGLIGLMEGDQK